jgi:hypothetical protein
VLGQGEFDSSEGTEYGGVCGTRGRDCAMWVFDERWRLGVGRWNWIRRCKNCLAGLL